MLLHVSEACARLSLQPQEDIPWQEEQTRSTDKLLHYQAAKTRRDSELISAQLIFSQPGHRLPSPTPGSNMRNPEVAQARMLTRAAELQFPSQGQ